ncbi:glycosyl hydrolase family 28 protein [Flagellimonas sp. HMM57]|uniref:glycoside hydrolase family 28 protein n=1 Tax=unclassified Flagellimonas TaxID=2644544 RepID=UPI0013D8CACC|nr:MULTISPECIES: glycosyl hydrolase family 28 protein [unclassified Flagellimonas]UII77667.1 glycosyl hydrolase family 28 protein [Flagellimonas sp. HMM57]
MNSNQKHFLLFLLTVFLIGLYSNKSFAQKPKEYNIMKYGAVPDGKTLNTEAIQKAIDKATSKGGGKVIVPEGKFLTGTLELKSNVELHVRENATLLGSTIPSHYRRLEMDGRPESPKKDDNSQLALIVAYKVDNISISGGGTIDGQGRALALAVDSLHHAGIAIDPNYNKGGRRPNEKMRPKLTRISTCRDVTFSKTKFRNSASWGLSFELCTNLTLDGIDINNQAYWNNDGMDITDSKNVKVINCNVNSADDGICLKSYYPNFFNDGVLIENCTVRSSASAIKFGTASLGGFKNVTIKDIKVYDTFRSAIAIESVDGGVIENINVSNIVAENTGNAIFIRLGHRSGEKPGSIKNVHIKDMKVEVPFLRPDIDYDLRACDCGDNHNVYPSSITGIPGHNVENVVLENIEISYPGRASKAQAYMPLHRLNEVPDKIRSYPEFSMFGELPAWGFYVRHTKGIQLNNITLRLKDSDFRPAFVFDTVEEINFKELALPEKKQKDQIVLKNHSNFKMTPENTNQVRIIE